MEIIASRCSLGHPEPQLSEPHRQEFPPKTFNSFRICVFLVEKFCFPRFSIPGLCHLHLRVEFEILILLKKQRDGNCP